MEDKRLLSTSTNWVKIFLLILLSLAVIGGSAFIGIQLANRQIPNLQSSRSQVDITPTPTVDIPLVVPSYTRPQKALTSGWKTFSNTKINLSFKMPETWTGYSPEDSSPQALNGTEEFLFLGPKNTTKEPPFIMQIRSYSASSYREPQLYPPTDCILTTVSVGVGQTKATHKICKGMYANGYITVKATPFVYIIEDLGGSAADHDLFNQILSTFEFTK